MLMAQSTPSRSLPLSTSPSLQLAQATDAERLTCWTLNSVHWGGDLPLPTCLRRREHLGDQPATRDGKLTYWVLVDSLQQPTPGDPRCILASCETFRKEALVSRPGPAGTGRLIEDAICHGVGSVFCREEFRGRGYAGRMMEELRRELLRQTNTDLGTDADRDGSGRSSKPRFSILYSDLGKVSSFLISTSRGDCTICLLSFLPGVIQPTMSPLFFLLISLSALPIPITQHYIL